MAENPQNIIRSWNLQTSFATGPVVTDKLVPPPYGRIRTNFVQTWRTQALSSLDWGAQNYSIYLPESLRVVSAIYLRLDVAANTGANYKSYPGLYAIRSIRLMSGGQEVYTCDRYCDFLSDYCQSLGPQELKHFATTYLGGQTATSGARALLLPILLPNSAYMNRNGYDSRGHGVMPCFLGQNRLEVQFTLNSSAHTSADGSNVTPAISSASLKYHEVNMTSANVLKYSDLRGAYSIITRRFTNLTPDWQHYDSANSVVRWNISQPQGVVTEVMILAVTHQTDDHRRSAKDYILPTMFRVVADSITQKELSDSTDVGVENWVNGFNPTNDFPSPGRLCFASHCGDGSTHRYGGGYNCTLSSNISFEFSFAGECDYRLVAVQLQRVKIDALGKMHAFLE
jgi:hypothetical protein